MGQTRHEKILRVDPVRPEETAMQTAGKILAQDGIVIFPAACLYGVAANALSDTAVEKVFSLKQRPRNNPILVLIHDIAMLKDLVSQIPKAAEILMDSFWPGRLTIVFKAAPQISPLLTARTGKIGIRMPGHPVARALARSVKFPITGTSANLSGRPGAASPADLPPEMIEAADLVLDAGPVQGGTGSTIVDVTGSCPKVLREGAVPSADLFKALG